MRRSRVAVADPSHFFRSALERLFTIDPRFSFLGAAGRGAELLEQLPVWRPDLLITALGFKDMSGVELIRAVVESQPTTIIVVDALQDDLRREQSMEALHAGAVDIIDKAELELLDPEHLQDHLIERISALALAEVNVKNLSQHKGLPAVSITTSGLFRKLDRHTRSEPCELVLIGASTGGPSAIQSVLEAVDGHLHAPIAIVQHMPSGFTSAFATRLDEHLEMPVSEAIDGALLRDSHVYIAPAGQHMRVRRGADGRCRCALAPSRGESAHCPSVDALFHAVAEEEELARRTIALLLTGMGDDGARGLRSLEKAGAHTIAQDQSTCVVFGMPAAAIALRAACEVLSLTFIGERLLELSQRRALRLPRDEDR